MNIKRNISKEVEAIGKIDITGNVIPPLWYQHLRVTKKTKNSDSNKPYLLAIVILSDIVYWYKPTYIRDEATSQVVEIKKKFGGDKLQRNPFQIAEMLGVSKTDASEALRYLRDKELITTELRTIAKEDKLIPNVMYIGVIPENIEKISTYQLIGSSQLTTTPTPQLTTTPTPQLTTTNTETLQTKITNTDSVPAPKTFELQNKKTKEPKKPAPLSLKNKLRLIEDEDEAAEAIQQLLEKDKEYFTKKYSAFGFMPENIQYYADLIAGQQFKTVKQLADDEKIMKSIIKTWSTFIFRKVNEGISPTSTLSNGYAQKNAPIEQYSEAYLLKILVDTDKHWVKDLKQASPQELADKLQTWKERKANDETMIGAFPQFAEKRIKAAYSLNLAK